MFLCFYVILILLGILFINEFIVLMVDLSKKKKQYLLNEKIKEQLLKENFTTTKTIYINDYLSSRKNNDSKKLIFVDSNNNKVCFIDYTNKNYRIVNFADILNYDVFENNNSSSISSYGISNGVAIGYSSRTNKCDNLKIFFYLKDYENSQLSYTLIKGSFFRFPISRSSSKYNRILNSLQSCLSFLTIIIDEKNKTKKTGKL